ncbi:hypothetical protein PG996_010509 [Apiospora saccharicola]|uniref:Uncharacterized protein n=1 Tax=Apiospora saccharicola TaxID=335842 RepID=A0ABR1UNT7_9PEZI
MLGDLVRLFSAETVPARATPILGRTYIPGSGGAIGYVQAGVAVRAARDVRDDQLSRTNVRTRHDGVAVISEPDTLLEGACEHRFVPHPEDRSRRSLEQRPDLRRLRVQEL